MFEVDIKKEDKLKNTVFHDLHQLKILGYINYTNDNFYTRIYLPFNYKSVVLPNNRVRDWLNGFMHGVNAQRAINKEK